MWEGTWVGTAQGSGCGPLLGRMNSLDKLARAGLQPKPADWAPDRGQVAVLA